MTKFEEQIFFLDNDYREYLYDFAFPDGAVFDRNQIDIHIDRLKKYMKQGQSYRFATDAFPETTSYFPEFRDLF